MRKSSPKRDSVTELFTKFAGQANTLIIPRHYIEFCNGDHLAALLLSQILYWSDRTDDPDGWFAKSYEDWYEETCLTKTQVMRLLNKDKRRKTGAFSLADVGIETKVRRSEFYKNAPTVHLRVNFETLQARIQSHLNISEPLPIVANDDYRKVANDNFQKVGNANDQKVSIANNDSTETIAKITSESDAPILLPEMLKAKHTPLREPQAKRSEIAPTPIAAAPLPQNYQALADSFESLHPFLEAWRQSHPGVKPSIPTTQRVNYQNGARDLEAAGVTAHDVHEFVIHRLEKKQSTAWTFIVSDIHVFLANRKPKPAPIQFANYVPLPQAAPLTKEEIEAIKAEVMRESAS